jgi:hypothetical protein
MKSRELRQLIREELNRIVVEDESSFIQSADRRIDRSTLKKALQTLKTSLSTEGWQVITKYISGAAAGGWNRAYAILQLAAVFGDAKSRKELGNFDQVKSTLSLKKADLRSYTNTILYGLLDTGDLIQDPKTKRYIPNTVK